LHATIDGRAVHTKIVGELRRIPAVTFEKLEQTLLLCTIVR
jgi:hypothetical protein